MSATKGTTLTPREMDVLRLIAKGLLNKQIASACGTTRKTVEQQATSIYRKLGIRGRVQATLEAQNRGLV